METIDNKFKMQYNEDLENTPPPNDKMQKT